MDRASSSTIEYLDCVSESPQLPKVMNMHFVLYWSVSFFISSNCWEIMNPRPSLDASAWTWTPREVSNGFDLINFYKSFVILSNSDWR